MSINSNMKSYILEEKICSRSKSGTAKEEWRNNGEIKISLYPISESIINNSVKLSNCTYTGLTTRTDIKSNFHRIKYNDESYSIMECKVIGKYTQLFLKELSNV